MKWLAASILLLSVAAALLAGWLSPRPVAAPAAPPMRYISRGGEPLTPADQAAAVDDLASFLGDDVSPGPITPPGSGDGEPFVRTMVAAPPPPPLPPPPPPPPPDVGLVFRQQVTGVIGEPGGRLAVMLADRPGAGVRRLEVGDRYDGAWTLIDLTREAAVLSDGEHRRRIPFFGGPVIGDGVNGE